jgi:hypothetical protein
VDPHPAPVLARPAPYDESRYLTALKERESPVLKFAAGVAG